MYRDLEGAWRKSTYSSGNGGNCLEVAFRTSSHSGDNGGNCVEVGGWHKSTHSGGSSQCVEVGHGIDVVAVRDTKDRECGMLTVSTADWRGFLASLR